MSGNSLKPIQYDNGDKNVGIKSPIDHFVHIHSFNIGQVNKIKVIYIAFVLNLKSVSE